MNHRVRLYEIGASDEIVVYVDGPDKLSVIREVRADPRYAGMTVTSAVPTNYTETLPEAFKSITR